MKKTHASTQPLMKPTVSTTNKMLYALIVFSVIAIGFGIYQSQQKAATAQAAAPAAQVQTVQQPGALVSSRANYDFGTISMGAGKVSTTYRIKNEGAAPLALDKIYTSCMCTEATLITASGRKQGPFGMPGHGPLKAVSGQLAAGETALLEVVFDPAAHGPSGVGRIERVITVEAKGAAPLELGMVAMVRP
jgi:hypothetical protein